MTTYNFRYIKGQNAPHGFVVADNDDEAGEAIREYLAQKGGYLMPGTITATTLPRTVPDPVWVTPRPRAA